MPQTSENRDIYLSQIHQLKQLQKVDDIIYEENKVLNQAPKELEELQDKFARVEAQRVRIQDKLTHLHEQEVRLARETEEESERLRKSKDKLMATGNEREFNAVNREIGNLEKMAVPREDERIALLEELKTQNALLEENEVEYIDLKTQVETRQVTMHEILEKAKKRVADLEEQRRQCSQDIPRPIFQRYEFIRERLEHPVIVALKDTICPSCHIAVPPQTFNDLLRGGQIMSCPNCQRLIVSYDDYIADDPEAIAARAEESEQSTARLAHKKASAGRSAALEREYKEDREDVDFGSATDELDDDLHMGNSIESDLNSMSRMADVSDLDDMVDSPDFKSLDGGSEENEKDD